MPDDDPAANHPPRAEEGNPCRGRSDGNYPYLRNQSLHLQADPLTIPKAERTVKSDRLLGKSLIVEGVETPDIHDALRVLGVEFAQGYAIARPMPREAVDPWLVARCPRTADPAPTSLLGAYAGHLRVVETCRVLMEQPLPVSWKEESKDPHSCAIGRYYDRLGTHDSRSGRAHKAFHEVLALYDTDRSRWQVGADQFRNALLSEILGELEQDRRCCG